LYREAEQAERKADFIYKMAIAQKGCNKTRYWLELLRETTYLEQAELNSLHIDGTELVKTAIIKSTKYSLTINN